MFTIFLRPVDNKPPQIVNTGMTVFERGTITITPDVLDATDEDTDDDILTFTVTSLPIRGFLVYDDMEIDVGKDYQLIEKSISILLFDYMDIEIVGLISQAERSLVRIYPIST